MKRALEVGSLAAAAIALAAPAASAAIMTQTVVGRLESDTGDPRFPMGGRIDFQVTWDAARAVKILGTPYKAAPMEILASLNGYSYQFGDINDGLSSDNHRVSN